jgi:thiamine biosynthesis lipoprotein
VTVVAGATAAGSPFPRLFEYQQVHMGLPVRILLHAEDERRAEAAARAAFERVAALDRVMSDYRPDSELRRLESTRGQWTPVSADLLEVLTLSLTMARATDGVFDPTVGPLVTLWRETRATGTLPPAGTLEGARARVGWRHLEIDRTRGAVRLTRPDMRLDLGGIAKGYILQQGLRALRLHGAHRALIESGGDIVVGGPPPGTGGWRVEARAAHAVFRRRAGALTDAALATSGSTEQFVEIGGIRYAHLVDPRTGLAVTHQTVARVIARDAATADALATALAILGPQSAAAVVRHFPDALVSVSTAGQ